MMIRAGESLTEIIDDILVFSKIEAGQVTVTPEQFNIRSFLHDNLAIFQLSLEQKQLGHTIHFDENLPEEVVADQHKIAQILKNLLSNAIKFTHEGRIDLHASMSRTSPDSGIVHFSVNDTGIGIDASKKDIIFKPFDQGDASYAKKYGGTGLGLAICMRLTTLLGGALDYRSAPDGGTSFTFSAPVRLAEKQPETVPDSGQPAFHLPRNLKILVAEDNELQLISLGERLRQIGATPTMANDGRAAVALVSRENFDLVLMDIQMPVMDGISATKEIRTLPRGRDIPIIALTAYVTPEQHQSFISQGVNACLTKPFKTRDLANLIHQVVKFPTSSF
jgi:CheY-like chemotaxis protein/anti-sigma regulatory factor (Ser/Thr protein kinase)